MVGVPGRSKGCNTCRKRKIACTLERPRCFQCTKSGRECAGYQKEVVFVTSDASSGQRGTDTWRPQTYRRPVEADAQARMPATTEQASIMRHQGIGIVPFREQIMATFLSHCKVAVSNAPGGVIPWIAKISAMPQPSKALQISAYAICTAMLGRELEDRDYLHTSRALYGQGLRAVNRALSTPRLALQDDTLGACMLLAVYEVFECADNARSGYLSHYEGCSKLIELRGPEAHSSGMAHAFFLAYRIMGTFESLLCKRTFLTDPAWNTTPFSDVPKTTFDKLLDLVLQASSFIERGDRLDAISSPQVRLEEAFNIIEFCWQLDEEYTALYEELKTTMNGPIYWPIFSVANGKILELEKEYMILFPLAYEFPNRPVAMTLILYWATLCILWSGMNQLYALVNELTTAERELNPTHDNTLDGGVVQLRPLEHRTNIKAMVHNVCQSVEYFTHEELGLPFLIAPLNMALRISEQWPGLEREIEWMRSNLEQVRRRGVGMARCLPPGSAPAKSWRRNGQVLAPRGAPSK